jgi:DNA-binding PadR family transcriptional regulator
MSEQLLPDNLLPLTPAVFHILLALSEGKKHGYAIMQDIRDITDGGMEIGPGTLYGSIKRMLRANLIEETHAPEDDDDPRRRYYQLTGLGKHVLAAEARRLDQLVQIAKRRKLLPGAG